jgi:predicted porin
LSAPSLLAGTLPFKGLDNHWLGYSFLTRQYVSTGLIGSFVSSRDVLPDPGEEAISSDLRMTANLTESWFGLTWAYKVKQSIGIGISPYFLVRSHNSSIQTFAQALTSNGKISLVLNGHEYRTKDDFMAADYQEKLDANYKTPLSLGIGLTYKFENVRLYGSAEWFAGMAKYEVMRGEDFTIQSTGETMPISLIHELESVLNFGIGIEYFFTPKLKTYASFTTDFSATDPDSDTNLSLSSCDIYHMMAGADFTLGNLSFTLGVGYAYGSRLTDTFTEGEALAAKEFLENTLSGMEYKYSNIKFVLGFAF